MKKSLQDKMDQFIPGWPEDASNMPTKYYQVLLGQVYTLLSYPDGSTARGRMTVAELEARWHKDINEEGWYSVLGEYLGEQLPGGLAD